MRNKMYSNKNLVTYFLIPLTFNFMIGMKLIYM